MKVFVTALLLVATVIAHVEDDEEAVVTETGEDEVTVEKVIIDEVPYLSPDSHPGHYFAEHFDDATTLGVKWTKSQAKKDGMDSEIAKYDGEWSVEAAAKEALVGDLGLVLKSKAKHAAVAARLRKPFTFDEKVLIVQYELNFQDGQECGGGYLKLLADTPGLDLRQFTDKTPYSIMFGPDKCGSDSKLHFIFNHQNPKTKVVEEKHCKKVEGKERGTFEEVFKNKRPHLYRLLIRPDNTFEISVDYQIVNHGSLLDSFTPPVNPPAEIDDPNDSKPKDWDEREKIQDPDAEKPEDWDETQPRQIEDEDAAKPSGWLDDEPEMVPDPDAEMPEDWDAEMDGDWEPPMIDNPACTSAAGCGVWTRPMKDNPLYKGKWFAPMINNPNYQGKWKPQTIPNPDYFMDETPYKMKPIGAVGIELWSMSKDIYFDNILITDNLEQADKWAQDTFDLKVTKIDKGEGGMFARLLDYSNKNPWLYAVYVVVVGLPLVLIVTFCCTGSGGDKSAAGKDDLNDPKKTDEPQSDDDQDGEEAAGEDEEGGEQGDGNSEEEEEEEEGEEEVDDDDVEEEEKEVAAGPVTRKRKPRKD